MRYSIVEDTIEDIKSEFVIASSSYDLYNEGLIDALVNYFTEIEEDDIEWSLDAVDYPDETGGIVFYAFTENNHLYTGNFDYVKINKE